MTPFSCRDGRNTLDHAWHCKRHATLLCHCMTTAAAAAAAAAVVVVVFSCSFCCPSWSLESVASDKKATTAMMPQRK